MKAKFDLRQLLLAVFPWLHVGMIIAPLFAYAAFYIWEKDIVPAYFLGLSVVLPVALTRLAILKVKNLFVYIIISLVLSGLWFLMNPILGALVLLVAVIRLAGRFRSGNKTVFDSPHYAGLAAFVLPFVFSAADDLPSLQFIALLSALCYGFMTLVYISLKKLDNYIALNREMADFPQRRVSSTTMRTVLSVAALIFAVSLVLLLVNFDFVSLPEFTNPGDEVEEEMIMSSEGYSGENKIFLGLPDLGGAKLGINWNAVGKVLVSVVATVIIIALAVILRNLAQNFSASALRNEEKDTIESIRDEEEKLISEKRGFMPDFSPNAYVRRKYRKAVRAKNYSPSPWQSPQEIESAAGIDSEVIHHLYEKARYSKEGCTAEDKKLL